MKSETKGQFSRLQVQVRFLRRYQFYLLTLYIPTTLLIIIAYATFFFNPDDFNSRIVVALTALLVLSSLYTQTSNSLPKTSYFKLIDIWLFFAIVIIFLVVMLQTLIDFSSGPSFFSRCRRIFRRSNSSLTKVQEHGSSEVRPYIKPASNRSGQQLLKMRKVAAWSLTRWNRPWWRWRELGKTRVQSSPYPILQPRRERKIGHSKTGEADIGMMRVGRALVPAIFIIFNLIYWSIALSYLASIDA